ncbi:hypothetical protein [Nocardia brasiliensis]|uniref:hypothetical protein n=1 Tax=Nocardia brasiliensis TaxID=37326 RepID=UPI003D8E0A77
MTTKTFDSARSVVWAGRLITLLGAGHTVGALILTRGFVDDWLAGDLWDSSLDLRAPQPILGAFFVSVASFGIPLLLVGWAITRMGHHNLIPPRSSPAPSPSGSPPATCSAARAPSSSPGCRS